MQTLRNIVAILRRLIAFYRSPQFERLVSTLDRTSERLLALSTTELAKATALAEKVDAMTLKANSLVDTANRATAAAAAIRTLKV